MTLPNTEATGPSGLEASSSSSPVQTNGGPNESNTGQSGTTGNTGMELGYDEPCQSCGAIPARFQCSACQGVRYCSQECQTEDWRAHYRECAEFIEAKKNGQGGTGIRSRAQSNSNGEAPGETEPNNPRSGSDKEKKAKKSKKRVSAQISFSSV